MIRKKGLKLSIYKKNTISFNFGNYKNPLILKGIHIPTERGNLDSPGI